MDPIDVAASRDERFTALYDAAYADLLRFVRRRVHVARAEDVVSDVMLVAWRRLDDVPASLSAARAWLFGVAYKTLQNSRRREDKQAAIAVRLAEVAQVTAGSDQSSDALTDRVEVASAWPLLSAVHQEAIALAVFDGLTAPEAARVLGITPVAFRLRLSRARKALRHHITFANAENDDLTTHRSPR